MKIEEQIFAYKELRNNGQAFFIDTYEDADRIIRSLEKQIPKEPKFYNCNYYCPSCDGLVGCHDTIMKWDNKFCKNCGKAIKW